MFDGLHIGLSALKTQKKSIETTGHNIANANNEDFSRQKAVQTTKQPNLLPGSDFQMGSGVKVADIERIQDEFINQQVREESQEAGYWDQIQQGMERIEYIFNEPSDSGLQSAFDSFWNSLQDLNSNPSDTATRSAVKNQGMVLTKAFRNINEQMSDYKRSLNGDVDKTVNEINSIADRISKYNKQITTALASNNKPNDLLDKREALFDELNELVSVKGSKDDIGNLNITVDGKKLVSKFDTNTLKTKKHGTYEDKVVANLNGNEVEVNPQGGELKGIMEVRDTEISNYLDKVDDMAKGLVDQFNKKHSNGFDLNGDTGNDFFQINNSYDRASRGIEVHSDIKADGGINKIAAGNFSEDPNVVTGKITDSTDIKTDRYYNVNVTENNSGNFDYKIVDSEGTNVASGTEPEGTELNFTNFNLTLNGTGETNVNFNTNQGNGNNASSLAESINQDKVLNGATITDNYQALISTVGVNAQRADQMKNSQQDLVKQLGNIKESVSGVSLDEEMANMIKYQQGYNAAAKVITKTDEMLQTLMGMVR